MKTLTLGFVAATAQLIAMGAGASAAPAHRVVLISIDGLTAQDAARLGEIEAETPVLDALVANGVRARGVIPTTPANTFPNHVTMVTGVSAATHGVLDNDTFAPGTGQHTRQYHYASDVKVKTLFDASREAGLKTMGIWWPVTTGAYIDQLLADVPGDVRERGKYVYASATPEIREVLGTPERAGEMTDALRLESAIAGLAGQPDFMAIHFTELDSAQHDYGAGSPEAMAALEETDRRIGEFLEALEAAGLREGTAIVIASDHGFSPLHSAFFPVPLFHAYGLLSLDEEGEVESWDAYPWGGGNGALAIYINPEAEDMDAARKTVDHLIDVMQSHPADFVKRVYRGDDIPRWGGFPGAYAVINAKSGFAFAGDAESVVFRTGTRTKGIHGFVPDGEFMHGALIMTGAGIRDDGRLGVVRMEDIAPTIAHLMGLSLPEAQGRALKEILIAD